MKIWNLFEQSGHFKDAEAEMDKWEKGKKSIFDEIKQDDFVFSFFPCIMTQA